MGTTLTGTTPQDTYDSLIKVTDNGPISGTLKALSDGLGNDSTLSLSTTAASIAGTLAVAGNATFDTSTLFVDAANNRVGIGTAAPASILQLERSSDSGSASTFPSLQVKNTLATQGDGSSTFNFSNLNLSSGNGEVNMFLLTTYAAGTWAPSAQLSVSSNHPLVFKTNNTEVGRFLAGGGLTFNGDTAAANALDDYEEGTWTMGLAFGGGTTGITFGARTGQYTKVGRMVTVTGQMVMTNKGSSTGIVRITGLPFTIGSLGGFYSSAAVRYENITYAGILQSFGDVNTTDLYLEQYSILGVGSILTDTNFANNSTILLSFTYFV